MSGNRFELLDTEPAPKVSKPKVTPAPKKANNATAASGKPNKHQAPQRGNGNRAPKHDGFDRRSGNGRGKEVRKNGGGKFNWGDKNPRKEEVAAEEAVAVAGKTAAAEGTEETPAAPVEEGPKVRTLDEFLKDKPVVRGDRLAPRKLEPVQGNFVRELVYDKKRPIVGTKGATGSRQLSSKKAINLHDLSAILKK